MFAQKQERIQREQEQNELEAQQETTNTELDNRRHLKKVRITRKHTHFRDWANKNRIDATMFNDIKFLGMGCDGLVMKCSISWKFNNNVENFTVALKMIINLHEYQTRVHIRTRNEYNILSNSALHLHPNIVTMFGEFVCKPTDNMIQQVDESIRDLCYRSNTIKKGAQFFMIQCYEKTLETVIKKEKPSKEMIMQYGLQISRALFYLYESKIAHLDLKLDNIMINE